MKAISFRLEIMHNHAVLINPPGILQSNALMPKGFASFDQSGIATQPVRKTTHSRANGFEHFLEFAIAFLILERLAVGKLLDGYVR